MTLPPPRNPIDDEIAALLGWVKPEPPATVWVSPNGSLFYTEKPSWTDNPAVCMDFLRNMGDAGVSPTLDCDPLNLKLSHNKWCCGCASFNAYAPTPEEAICKAWIKWQKARKATNENEQT